MDIKYIQKSVVDNFHQLKQNIVSAKAKFAYTSASTEYAPLTHRVMTDHVMRPDKKISVIKDDAQAESDEPNYEQQTVYVTRLPVPYQKKIVRLRATFLCGNPIKLDANAKEGLEQDLLELIQKTWDDNKLDYKSKGLAKLMMSELEVAELWYPEPADKEYWADTPNAGGKTKLRMKIIGPKFGDSLYPVFDEYGDMVAFGREYVTKSVDDKKTYHFDVYTAEATYYATQKVGTYTVDGKPEPNQFKKIPIVYYSQEAPEWADVQKLIDQYEISLSDHTDTNQYHGDPTTVVEGGIVGFSKKGEKGKVLEVEPGAKVNLLAWEQATNSLELEQKNLRGHILNETSTPDISFQEMKGLGNFSGIALKMLFLDAHMAAADKEEIFGECIQRRINFLKAAHAQINPSFKKALPLKITPKFEYYLPKNDQETVSILMTANGNKPIISKKTAVTLNPLVEDSDAELDQIEAEQKEADKKEERTLGLNNFD
jgi:SPP1 family phage portal protein